MSDKRRCINAFLYQDRIIAGGQEVDGDDPILETHGAHFADPVRRGATVFEAATAAPGELRNLTPAVKRGPGRPRKEAPKVEPVKVAEKTGDE